MSFSGSNDIPINPVYCRTFANPKGVPIQVPIYKCGACNRHVSRQSLATSLCPQAGQEAKRRTLQGLRGVRVTEASHPGPAPLKI